MKNRFLKVAAGVVGAVALLMAGTLAPVRKAVAEPLQYLLSAQNSTPIPPWSMLVGGSDGTTLRPLKTLTDGTQAFQASYTPSRATLQASAAQTVTNQSALVSVGVYREAVVTLSVTAASGTSPTLAVTIQVSDDGGTTWYALPGGAFTSATGVTSQALQIVTFGDTIRVSSVIGGTTPSFTYSVKAVLKQ